MKKSEHFRALTVLFTLALALRLGYLAIVWTGPLGNADSAAYKALAISLQHGGPYQADESAGPGGFPTDLQRPPGYPAFLALVNWHEAISNRRTAIIQCVLGSVFVLLLALLLRPITNFSVGLIAALFFATDWITIVHTPMVIAETIYSCTLGLAILLYAMALQKQYCTLALLSGFALGVAALIKPAAQIVVIAFLIAWAFQKQRRWTTLLFLFSYLACVAPWMMRNEHMYGVGTLSEIGTADLYFYSAQGSLASYSLSDVAGRQITNDVQRLDREWRAQSLRVSDRRDRMRHEAMQLIAAHWPKVIEQAILGFARTATGTAFVTAADSMPTPPSQAVRIGLGALPLLQVMVLWAMAIYGALGRHVLSKHVRVLFIGSILCILIPSASPLAQSRFRVPAVPVLSALAAAGVTRLRTKRPLPQPAEGECTQGPQMATATTKNKSTETNSAEY